MKRRDIRALEIQDNIREALMKNWDPIGVAGVPEVQDEYDGYIGGVYCLLANGASEKQIIDHLYKIETEYMELESSNKALKEVAEALRKISVKLQLLATYKNLLHLTAEAEPLLKY